ncbi:hypothetical protein NDA11_007535 [Ustilago hordei]|nr:hypothetical protein NDA11_007535 [Ustilago hordei]
MITPPWVLDTFALQQIADLPDDRMEHGWATFRHYYYNSYKVPCLATFVIWGLFLTLILAAASSALVEHLFPRLSHTMSRKLTWWRGNISEHPLVSQRHSQIVTCGKGCFRWLTFHLPLRLEAMILVAMLAANIAPIVGFYSLYVGNNTYFTGTDAVSRRSQILRHLANRCAMLGISQLPMLILLSSKRTPVAILSQLSMNTMMLFHRWIARTCYCHIIIHTLGNALIFHYSVGFVESMRLLPVQLGTVALITLSGLVFLSLRTLRKKHYEMFVFMHISMAFFMILFTYLHIRFLHQGRLRLQIFVIELTAAFWAFDRTVRFLGRVVMSLSWRHADGAGATRKAELTSYAKGAYIRMRIQIPASRLCLPPLTVSTSLDSSLELGKNMKHCCNVATGSLPNAVLFRTAKIGAGDDIRISVPKLQWVGEHPFSVFGVGRCKSGSPDMGYIDLVIQRQAGLTQKLSKLAEELTASSSLGSIDSGDEHSSRPKGRRVRVVIDGPFGKSPSLEGARHAVLIAGGIAITFCYPLFVKAARGEFRSLESCKLVWIVRNEAILDVLRDSLPELLEEIRSRGGNFCKLSIDIYVTLKRTAAPVTQLDTMAVDRRGSLPMTLEHTWKSNSYSLHSPSSSVTLSYGGEDSCSSGSPQVSTSNSQVWDGVRYDGHSDVVFVPTLLSGHSTRHQSPQPAYMSDEVFRTRTERSTCVPYSPYASQVTFSQLRKEMSNIKINLFSPKSPIILAKSTRLFPTTLLVQDEADSVGHRTGIQGPQEVLLDFQAKGKFAHGAETPRSAYSVASSQCTGYQINGSSTLSSQELQLQSTSDNLWSASTAHSMLHPDSPGFSYHSQHEANHRQFLSSQDVLAESQGGLIEVRRFQGRPSSMAAVHGHILQQEGDATGRVAFATCGPAPMCDSVRAEVVALLKKGLDVALVEDCFNW